MAKAWLFKRLAEFITTLLSVCYYDQSDDCSYVSSPFVKRPAAAAAMVCERIYCNHQSAAALDAIATTALGRSTTITLERLVALPIVCLLLILAGLRSIGFCCCN